MRAATFLLLLGTATPALAQHKLAHDFRGSRFDPDVFRYLGPTPAKFMTPEPEGLRLRYTGVGAPAGNPAAVGWQFHVRGDFVATARYEILQCEPPKNGTFAVGAEMYLMLGNGNKDGISLARGVYPNGKAKLVFTIRTNDAKGKRANRIHKWQDTTDRSLKGRLRMERKGAFLTALFAEADDAEFKELERSEIGTADVRMVRFTGLAGGDSNAVLDMRIVDFQLEGEDLALNGRFVSPPRGEAAPVAKEAAFVEQAVAPVVNAEETKLNLLILIGVLFLVVVPGMLIIGVVLFLRMRKNTAAITR